MDKYYFYTPGFPLPRRFGSSNIFLFVNLKLQHVPMYHSRAHFAQLELCLHKIPSPPPPCPGVADPRWKKGWWEGSSKGDAKRSPEESNAGC
mmetsp:Transcript_31404/g.76615  ORF Transcript_31404/g.76615 Transcript_31404/m.76615 type:complete len:92 (+) Transcript_31404:1104-1379(+)